MVAYGAPSSPPCFGEHHAMARHRYQPMWCSWSSFSSSDYFLLQCFQFSGSTQTIAIHEFLREEGKRFLYAAFSFTALGFTFFSSFFHRFKFVWLEIGKGMHCHEVCRRFDWKAYSYVPPITLEPDQRHRFWRCHREHERRSVLTLLWGKNLGNHGLYPILGSWIIANYKSPHRMHYLPRITLWE